MALTQTATITGPSWDEEVVPALRKRLESESRTIARRISAISVTSDDGPNISFGSSDYNSYQYQSSTPASTRPRPSLQQSRASSDNPRVTPTTSSSARSRTYSQPWAKPNGKPNGSAVARAVSPRQQQDPRPTRIPQPASRSRAGSTSSHSYSLSGSINSPYSSPKPPQTVEPDLWVLPERPGAASRSTISVASPQDAGLLHEPPPFQANSTTSSNDHSTNRQLMDVDPPRRSIDSEEHPYEHWYRGDVSRNGGVGELRVAKRQEMLEIANYGHTLRAKQAAVAKASEERRRHRRRADSVGPTNRQSFYMDDDGYNQVKDEAPLTDLEGDTSDYHSHREANSDTLTPHDARLPSLPQQSRIPTPTRQLTDPTRTTTPTQVARGKSEPPSFPSTPGKPPSFASSSTTQKRAASPQQNGSKTKKTKAWAAKATRAKTEAAKKERDDAENRRSVAYYPTPGDDMMDAIPSWTQPVPREGNWDDVVLPVVARKKGLDGHYEHADGSPRAKQVESAIAPAPGTFGYDHTKYRPPRDDDPSSIPMDEFGRPARVMEEADEEDEPRMIPASVVTNYDRTALPTRSLPLPPSPAPFSHYRPIPEAGSKLQPVSTGVAKLEVEHTQPLQDEGDGGGCCKCVVM